jgi:hypothetical protein
MLCFFGTLTIHSSAMAQNSTSPELRIALLKQAPCNPPNNCPYAVHNGREFRNAVFQGSNRAIEADRLPFYTYDSLDALRGDANRDGNWANTRSQSVGIPFASIRELAVVGNIGSSAKVGPHDFAVMT